MANGRLQGRCTQDNLDRSPHRIGATSDYKPCYGSGARCGGPPLQPTPVRAGRKRSEQGQPGVGFVTRPDVVSNSDERTRDA